MSIGTWLKKKGEEYRAGEPERREKKLSKLKHKLAVQRVREDIGASEFKVRKQKLELGERRMGLTERRRRAMPSGGPFGPSLFPKPTVAPLAPKPAKKRRKKKKKK